MQLKQDIMYICFQAKKYAHFLSNACDPKLDLFVAQLRDVIEFRTEGEEEATGKTIRPEKETKSEHNTKCNQSKMYITNQYL